MALRLHSSLRPARMVAKAPRKDRPKPVSPSDLVYRDFTHIRTDFAESAKTVREIIKMGGECGEPMEDEHVARLNRIIEKNVLLSKAESVSDFKRVFDTCAADLRKPMYKIEQTCLKTFWREANAAKAFFIKNGHWNDEGSAH